jgi:hypothetical protein
MLQLLVGTTEIKEILSYLVVLGVTVYLMVITFKILRRIFRILKWDTYQVNGRIVEVKDVKIYRYIRGRDRYSTTKYKIFYEFVHPHNNEVVVEPLAVMKAVRKNIGAIDQLTVRVSKTGKTHVSIKFPLMLIKPSIVFLISIGLFGLSVWMIISTLIGY